MKCTWFYNDYCSLYLLFALLCMYIVLAYHFEFHPVTLQSIVIVFQTIFDFPRSAAPLQTEASSYFICLPPLLLAVQRFALFFSISYRMLLYTLKLSVLHVSINRTSS